MAIMQTVLKKARKKKHENDPNKDICVFIGSTIAFVGSLKLYHWEAILEGNKEKRRTLEHTADTLLNIVDKIAETTYTSLGRLNVTIPEVKKPDNIVQYASDYYDFIEMRRDLFEEESLHSIIDDYQEILQRLIYKLVSDL